MNKPIRIFTIIFLLLLSFTQARTQEYPLESVMDSLAMKFNISFAYDASLIKQLKSSFPKNTSLLEECIRHITAESGLEYIILGDHKVLLRQRDKTQPVKPIRIEGQLLDAESHEPLAFAAIFSDDLSHGTISDDQGKFFLTSASKNLNIQFLGYEAQRIPLQDFPTDGIIYLHSDIQEIERIDVIFPQSKQSYFRDASTSFKNSGSINSYAQGLLDPIARLKMSAGFAGYDDLNINTSFRGSSADANMYILDGLPIIEIDHFFGIFSAIQESIVDHLDVYKNNWPIQKGGKTGALVMIEAREQDSLNAAIALSTITADGHINIPISSFGSVLVSGRTSLGNISDSGLFQDLYDKPQSPIQADQNRSTLLTILPSFQFNDYYIKGKFRPGQKTELQINHFASNDHFKYDHNETTLIPRLRRMIMINETFKEMSDWTNRSTGIALTHEWSENHSTSLEYTRSNYSIKEEINLTVGSTQSDEIRVLTSNLFENEVSLDRLEWNNSLGFNNEIRLNFGAQIERIETISDVIIEGAQLLNVAKQTNQYTGFLELQSKQALGWSWNFGSRFTWDKLNARWLILPQLGIKNIVNPNLQIKGAVGYSQQVLRQTDYEDRFGRKRGLWTLAQW